MAKTCVSVRRSALAKLAVSFIVCALITWPAECALAAAGDLDLTFAVTGIALSDVNANSTDTAYAVLVQPDAKVVALGDARTGTKSDFALARYNGDGTPDGGFGSGGIVVTTLSAGDDVIHAGALQGDGSIVVAGSSGSSVAVARYLSLTGVLDPSFGSGGIVTTSIGALASGEAVVIQGDGKIVVAGTANSHFFVARYTTAGGLDSSFHGAGIVTTTVGAVDVGQGLALQADGKIVVAGYSDTGTTDDFTILRYTSGGILDNTFNATGKVTTDFQANSQDQAHGIAIQPNGKIVVAGFVNAGGHRFGVARYNTNGSLDATFGAGGKVMTAYGAVNEAKAVAIQPTGKIVVAGDMFNGADYDFVVMRYLSTGALDTSFNSLGSMPGVAQNDLSGAGSDDLGYAVAIQPDNKIVVAGSCDRGAATALDFAVARYESPTQPPVVTSFGKTIREDETLRFNTADFTGHFSDPEAATMATVMITTLPLSGTLALAGSPVTMNQEITPAALISLTFTPDAAWYGNTSFGWNASNGIVYAVQDATAGITVTYVNHAPSFIRGQDQSVQVGAGAQIVPAWATSILPGPASEAWQVVTFTLVTSNNALFGVLPVIDAASGELRYTPSAHVWGSATVTVTLRDDGGTANGGVDTSSGQAFTLVVQPYTAYLPVVRRGQ